MAAATQKDSDKVPLLQRLYESRAHADLIIRTATKDIPCHKCIVSTASPFFQGANRGSFKESEESIIQVEEDAEVMDALLRHMYGVPLSGIPESGDPETVLMEKAGVVNFQLAIAIRTASDKYLLTGLDQAIDSVIGNCMVRAATVVDFLEMTLILETRKQKVEEAARMIAIFALVLGFKDVLSTHEAWAMLHADSDYQRTVVECFYDAVNDDFAVEDSPEKAIGSPLFRFCAGKLGFEVTSEDELSEIPVWKPFEWGEPECWVQSVISSIE